MSDVTGNEHPMIVFCEICSKKQKLPRIFWMTFPFMYNFRSLSNKFATILCTSLPRLSLVLEEKRKLNLKFLKPKMRCREKFSVS